MSEGTCIYCERDVYDCGNAPEHECRALYLSLWVAQAKSNLDEAQAEIARVAEAVRPWWNDGDSTVDTVTVVVDVLGHTRAAEEGLRVELDAANAMLREAIHWVDTHGAMHGGARDAAKNLMTRITAHLEAS
jgi:hypothetical protein